MSFGDQLQAFETKTEKAGHDVVRLLVLEIGRRVVFRTQVGDTKYWKTAYPPKGYVGGRARANWQHSLSGVTKEVSKPEPRGKSTFEVMHSSIPRKAAVKIHLITNNRPYIKPLEYGHSGQAPNGMVGLTLAELDEIIRYAARGAKR